MNKQFVVLGVIGILIAVGLSGCLENKNENNRSIIPLITPPIAHKLTMNFHYNECGTFAFNRSEIGINETLWLNNSTLSVKAYVLINCGEIVENGSFQIVNNTITLYYISPECIAEECKDCMCGVVLFYNFTYLEKKNYTFELIRLFQPIKNEKIEEDKNKLVGTWSLNIQVYNFSSNGSFLYLEYPMCGTPPVDDTIVYNGTYEIIDEKLVLTFQNNLNETVIWVFKYVFSDSDSTLTLTNMANEITENFTKQKSDSSISNKCIKIEQHEWFYGEVIEGHYIGPDVELILDYDYQINDSLKAVYIYKQSIGGAAGSGYLEKYYGVYDLPYDYYDLEIIDIYDDGAVLIHFKNMNIVLRSGEEWTLSTSAIDIHNYSGETSKALITTTRSIVNYGFVEKSSLAPFNTVI